MRMSLFGLSARKATRSSGIETWNSQQPIPYVLEIVAGRYCGNDPPMIIGNGMRILNLMFLDYSCVDMHMKWINKVCASNSFAVLSC
jgi:hypothetical protein